MTNTVTHGKPSRAPLPDHVLFLPGRSVDVAAYDIDDNRTHLFRGVVTDVDVTADPPRYSVRFVSGLTDVVEADAIRLVYPDRPALAHDELYAQALGRIFARRSGREDDFGGEPTREVGWREAARDALRELDGQAFAAKRSGCPYTYVVDPAGVRRDGRSAYVDGDTLVACPWYGDGAGRAFCAVHSEAEARGERSSIFYPSESGPWRYEAPIQVGPDALVASHRAASAAMATAQEATRIAAAIEPPFGIGDVIARCERIIVAVVRAYKALHGHSITGEEMRRQVVAKLAEEGQDYPGGAYWSAVGAVVRSGEVRFETGPRYSPGERS